ncbi:alpha/beta fold hydrolase [Gordonia soli]|uniref:Putative esterase n=1 Tax=Gordonia soli NBRC 108243 TaxID=1223545 RepID=M0QQ79_9ACTN|nr:alpha/beta hydrolase [Gordonia soli]GAC69607.1 putative esterase [Gordonia soli NBRC 108243]
MTIDIHHETHGLPSEATPLLLIHGGGSTIGTNWGRFIPMVAPSRQIIAVELQGHGHTASHPERTPSFENSADDLAALLTRLDIGPVDVLGFSNGGNTAMRLAMRHPGLVRRQIIASALFRRDGMIDGFWDGFAAPDISQMPTVYLDADRAINPDDPEHQRLLFELDVQQMSNFADWATTELAQMRIPTLVIGADRDVVRTEHTVELAVHTPDARVLVVPGNHGDFLGEEFAADDDTALRRTLPWLIDFLDQP